MTAQEIRRFLGFCTLLNYAILIVWFALFTLGHSFIYRLHTTWFPMSEEAYSQVNYLAMAIYESLIFVFNVIPYIALRFGLRPAAANKE